LAIVTDNHIKIWQLEESNIRLVSEWPATSKILSRVIFCTDKDHHKLLFTGVMNNTQLQVWDWTTKERLQEITIFAQDFELANHIAFDPTFSFLFVANSKHRSGLVFHVDKARKHPIDYVSEIDIAQPVVSLVVQNQTTPSSLSSSSPNISQDQNASTLNMEIFCVQMKAIQSCSIRPDQCYLPDTSSPQLKASTELKSPPPVIEKKLNLSSSQSIETAEPAEKPSFVSKPPEPQKSEEKVQDQPTQLKELAPLPSEVVSPSSPVLITKDMEDKLSLKMQKAMEEQFNKLCILQNA
jgi:hypothetical protein